MKHILSVTLLICTILIGCKSQDVPQKPTTKAETSLIGTKWVLTKLNGDLVNLTSPELQQPYIILTGQDNAVGGNGGCNGLGGVYTLTDNQTIAFSELITTMMYCDDHGIESMFIANLHKATTYTLVDNELTFKDENGYVLVSFEPTE